MAFKFNPFTGTLDDVGSGGGSTSPGGSTTQLQFNDAGAFGGDADLTWNKTTNVMTISGDVNLSDGGTYTTTLQTITPTAARTISLPDATGTVALVAGSSGQLLYNNAGVNAGVSGSAIGVTGDITLSLNGAASTPPLDVTGTWFTGGTSTTTKPQVLIEPTGATSTAWSTSGTGLGVNAASGFGGNLLDLQVNGTSGFNWPVAARVSVQVGGNYLQFNNTSPSAAAGWYFAQQNNLACYFGSSSFNVTGSFTAGSTITGTTINGSSVDITGDNLRLRTAKTPATSSATGNAGDHCWDANYLYVCTATNTWKRAALTTW
jgi:hypothetical protein